MDPLAELVLDLEELQQQDDFADMVELDMVDMEDMVELDSLCEHASKVCLPACDPPCAPSLEPLTDISGRTSPCLLKRVHINEPQMVYMVNFGALLPTNSPYLLTTEASTVYVCDVTSDTTNYKLKRAAGKHQFKLSRILGQSTPTSPRCLSYIPPVPSSSLPQQASLHTAPSTVSGTTSSNHLGNQVSARLVSSSSDPFDFSDLHSKLGQEESTARWKLAVLQGKLDNHRHHCHPHCPAATAVIGAKITVLQQELSDIVARKVSLRARDPNWLGVYPREGSILHPPYPSWHALHLP